ncbi:Putative acetyl-CoA C-acetyltransferase YhfS [Roseovarius gaetbuli]|uniref:Putative acetyl-CoA C-acetyltransferase YhfS n=1 Tax=Roseovarius gaetbuli TaxID=1356575 RepID=A0A1X6YHZ7_9RHOB|nr:thiolase family protein [Roseovarius gaetbuli]SLN20147.1 Putative acetyl-CoA C-acetyltransferase YhfS [Roseovarius gaetbuli]
MTHSYIVAAKRSAVVPLNGAFAHLEFLDIAAPVIRACLVGCGLAPEKVGEVIVGNALGAGGNPARLCALAAGLPEQVAGLSIDRQCASGLDALNLADAMIRSGQAEIVVVGGAESYSRRPERARTFADGRPALPYAQARFTPWPDRDPDMHVAADALATEHGITRAAQDAWAVQSHDRALKARARLARELVTIGGITKDPFTRALSPGLCARSRAMVGTITPANTSVAADGAAFCVVVSERIARCLDAPAVRIIGGCTLGGCPDLPGLAPVAAIKALLDRANITPDHLTVAEIMEAYAAQAIACVTESGLNPEIVNPGGGSLARGHPIGASGAINAVRLYHELVARGGIGIAAIAAAGGIGTALLLRA